MSQQSTQEAAGPAVPNPRVRGVNRVLARLPGRGPEVSETVAPLIAAIRESPVSSEIDQHEVLRAYEYAAAAHGTQTRSSGEPYIVHPVAVATVLAGLGARTNMLVAALLHDVVEDTPASREEIAGWFNDDVAHLVDGVTKLARIKVKSKEEQQARTLRKFIETLAKDRRVLVIKLADRLHNMQTIDHVRREKQKRVAQETLDIYAPLAHRIGMQNFRLQLEDLSFRTLHPKRYEELVAMVDQRQPERDAFVTEVVAEVEAQLKEVRVRAEVIGRPKHYWAIYEKMVQRSKMFEEIHDLVGVRVLVDSVADCYAALGQVHAHWRPVPGRFKDYIAVRKSNNYQSLHTTVVWSGKRNVEIQIRTHEMHRVAELGVAAHWRYKGRDSPLVDAVQDVSWLDDMADLDTDDGAHGDFIASVKDELDPDDEVFVFTPDGDLKALPEGATPVDFAYAVHTEVGHRCVGARVNDRLVPLDYQLATGDKVEVLTSKAEDAGPSRDWLEGVASPRTKAKIRAWFNRERRQDAEERGRDQLARAMRRAGISLARAAGSGELADVANGLNYTDLSTLFRAIGDGHVDAHELAQQVITESTGVEDDAPDPVIPTRQPIRIGKSTDGVEVDGDTGMLVKLARCCTPVPGDEIVGYVTRGRGVSVHRGDCTNIADLAQEPERFIDVAWSGTGSPFLVQVQVEAYNRTNLLRDITAVLGDLHIDILSAQVTTRRDRVAVARFTFELADPAHLDYALRQMHVVEGVFDVYRATPQAV